MDVLERFYAVTDEALEEGKNEVCVQAVVTSGARRGADHEM